MDPAPSDLLKARGRTHQSLLAPLPELESRLQENPPGQPVVVCHSGSRSALATQQFLRAGLERVANLRGGISAWEA